MNQLWCFEWKNYSFVIITKESHEGALFLQCEMFHENYSNDFENIINELYLKIGQ